MQKKSQHVFQIYRKLLNAHTKGLPILLDWIEEMCVSLSMKALHQLQLAVEEVFMNIIHHGYKDSSGMVEVIIEIQKQEIHITLRDEAPPFDYLAELKPIDPMAPIESRDPGGIGLHLIHHMVDEVKYERSGSWNVVTLVKQF